MKISKALLLSAMLFFFFAVCSKPYAQDVRDYDGNVYKTVKIGQQIWMKENLKVKHYNNGDSIIEVRDSVDWVLQTGGAWSVFNNDLANGTEYGILYNGFAVSDTRGLAPLGWHVPSDDDWKALEIFLGMNKSTADLSDWRGADQGAMLKETDTIHWKWPTGNVATNSSGFTALGSGWRNHFNPPGYTSFVNLTATGQWWTSTPYNTDLWMRNLCVYHSDIYRTHYPAQHGCAVRCIKNSPANNYDLQAIPVLKISVNNNSKQITLTLTAEFFDVELFDIYGRRVFSDYSAYSDVAIDTRALSGAVYILSIKTQTQLYIRKIIIDN